MASPSTRLALCLVVGLFAGVPLGILFVPDPTGVVAFVATMLGTTAITVALYRSDWLRE
ncbi:hypothetical protein SAMN04488065_1744 [Haloplanus vescus]|uniref:Uncharacterized protein n=1 Tax=Haloplanus vescus TaxID=555874 RepID=A0A1H3Y9R2_9EURY|nr:hypothetical protein [Haloplanus vescus]SEA08280.1 hypothetical protein SAMN04488065_1744 [Haloplanus vescus]